MGWTPLGTKRGGVGNDKDITGNFFFFYFPLFFLFFLFFFLYFFLEELRRNTSEREEIPTPSTTSPERVYPHLHAACFLSSRDGKPPGIEVLDPRGVSGKFGGKLYDFFLLFFQCLFFSNLSLLSISLRGCEESWGYAEHGCKWAIGWNMRTDGMDTGRAFCVLSCFSCFVFFF